MTTALNPPSADVGIIVGRFQVHELHEAHSALIETVAARHDHVVVFIGLSPLRNTTSNPLDFAMRKKMFQESYPNIDVHYIDDCRTDDTWSKKLDQEIDRWLKPRQTALLYGGRDSFISHYHGKYPAWELEPATFISGKEIRRRIANNYPATQEFRAGVIAASFNRFPTCYPTVDVAIIDQFKQLLLLGQKPGETKLRFIGGFANPESPSYEADVRREVSEESGVEVDSIQYIGSALIDDWRYKFEVDKIKTLFFTASYTFGRPKAGDDIASVTWVQLADVLAGKVDVIEEHRPLVEMLKNYLQNTSYNSSR